MRVTKASTNERVDALQIAKSLNEWFTKEGLENMQVDFEKHNVAVAKKNGSVIGFICYALEMPVTHLLWMGVIKNSQRGGVGNALLSWLENECRKNEVRAIHVETLPDEDSYEPYRQTRNFYYKSGFVRIAYKKAQRIGWDDQILLEKIL